MFNKLKKIKYILITILLRKNKKNKKMNKYIGLSASTSKVDADNLLLASTFCGR
jgi:hypothetical protein